MANYTKSFNFRNGVQVDDDNFVINPSGLVGIGTSQPNKELDVLGDGRISGITSLTHVGVVGVVTVGTGITMDAATGIITANYFKGDGSELTGIGNTGWNQLYEGSGLTTSFNIGIGTTQSYNYQLQIGNDPVTDVGVGITEGNITISGLTTTKNLFATGISTVVGFATFKGDIFVSGMSTFTGITSVTGDTFFAKDVTASGISTLNNVVVGGATTELVVGGDTRVTGVITANVLSAESLTTQYRIPYVGVGNTLVESGATVYTDGVSINATTFNGSSFTGTGAVLTTVQATTFSGGGSGLTGVPPESFTNTGIGTVKGLEITGLTTTNILYSNNVGVGTTNPTSDLEVKKPESFVQFVGQTGVSTVSIGQSLGIGHSTGGLRFGNSTGTFDVFNNDKGNFDSYIHKSALDHNVGVSTGDFRWIHKNSNVRMVLTYDGNLGVGNASPEHKLHVAGISTFDQKAHFETDVDVVGTLSAGTLTGTLSNVDINNPTINNTTGLSTFFNLNVKTKVGINSSDPQVELDGWTALQGSTGASARLYSLGISTDKLEGNKLSVDGGGAFTGTLGIGTTALSTEIYGDVGQVQIHGGSVYIEGGGVLSNNKFGNSIGIGTTQPRCVADFSLAGRFTEGVVPPKYPAGHPSAGQDVPTSGQAFFLPPTISTAERDGTGGNVGLGTAIGAIIYNTTVNKLQVYTNQNASGGWETITSAYAG
mgnify:FL=1